MTNNNVSLAKTVAESVAQLTQKSIGSQLLGLGWSNIGVPAAKKVFTLWVAAAFGENATISLGLSDKTPTLTRIEEKLDVIDKRARAISEVLNSIPGQIQDTQWLEFQKAHAELVSAVKLAGGLIEATSDQHEHQPGTPCANADNTASLVSLLDPTNSKGVLEAANVLWRFTFGDDLPIPLYEGKASSAEKPVTGFAAIYSRSLLQSAPPIHEYFQSVNVLAEIIGSAYAALGEFLHITRDYIELHGKEADKVKFKGWRLSSEYFCGSEFGEKMFVHVASRLYGLTPKLARLYISLQMGDSVTAGIWNVGAKRALRGNPRTFPVNSIDQYCMSPDPYECSKPLSVDDSIGQLEAFYASGVSSDGKMWQFDAVEGKPSQVTITLISNVKSVGFCDIQEDFGKNRIAVANFNCKIENVLGYYDRSCIEAALIPHRDDLYRVAWTRHRIGPLLEKGEYPSVTIGGVDAWRWTVHVKRMSDGTEALSLVNVEHSMALDVDAAHSSANSRQVFPQDILVKDGRWIFDNLNQCWGLHFPNQPG